MNIIGSRCSWSLFLLLLVVVGSCSVYSQNEEANINEVEFTNSIPQYWEDYFNEKRVILARANQIIENNGASLLFVTDVHVGTNNMKSPTLIKYLVDHKYVNKVVCGGDLISGFQVTKEDALNELSIWANAIKPIPVVTILGNHDLNSNDQKDSMQIISENDFFHTIYGDTNLSINYVQGELYGYEDDEINKTRFIYLNTKAPDLSVIDNKQILWMKDCILELNKGWTVIVFCHQFWTGAVSSVKDLKMDNNGVLIENALNDIYDKTNATIACVIAGHCHRNYSKYSPKGYPIIATTCDTGGSVCQDYDPDTPYRISGTTTEQAFDLYYINNLSRRINVIRIGAGDSVMDRAFSF